MKIESSSSPGWVVWRRWAVLNRLILPLGLFGLSLVALPGGLRAQGIRSIIESRERVFSNVGAGVIAMKHAPNGDYYILTRPANRISVYSPDGKLMSQIPKTGSGVAIRYAVGIDLTPTGMIAVADRGENAIDVFRPDGSIVSRTPVFAPTSVVALSDSEFAITTLRSRQLVEVIDLHGTVLQHFGDPTDVDGNPKTDVDAETEELFGGPRPKETALHDYGTITGDSAGGIYFAFASTSNPTLRKYDQYGYQSYQASIPKSDFGGGAVQPDDRVQLLFGFSDVSFSNQEGGWLSLGSSEDVKFGGNVGTGIGESLRRGYGFGQAVDQQNMREFGSSGAAGGPLGATFSGEVNSQGSTNFQLGMGSTSGFGGRGRRAGLGQFGDQTTSGGALLQFSGSNDDSSSTADTLDIPGSGTTEGLGMYGSGDSTSDSGANSPLYSFEWLGPPPGAQGTMGMPASFLVGSSIDGAYFRPRGLSQEITGAPSGAKGASGVANHVGARTGGFGGSGFHPGYHGRFNSGMFGFTAGLRVNLGSLDRGLAVKEPKITAVAVDPQTHDMWAAIADTLVEFNSDGSPIGLYYLTLAGGQSLTATALLVEPDRLLIAADPWGIFEFPRPDKPEAQQKFNVVPKVVDQPR
ncbi:MAG TPA: hypothetical protein VMF66_04665 [Candidatus Acidoferrum sp.]|nr:hypothetical protein [Candidatus Acidoferrum sp.]